MVPWLVDGVWAGGDSLLQQETFNINNYLKSYDNALTKKNQHKILT